MLNRLDTAQQSLPRGEESGGFDIHDAVNFFWRQWKLILGVAGATLLVAAVYLTRATPLYTATTSLLLEPNRDRPLGQNSGPDMLLDPTAVESQMTIIRSNVLLRRVVERERLVSDSEFGASPPTPVNNPLLAAIRDYFPATTAAPSASKAGDALSTTMLDGASREMIGTIDNVRSALSVTLPRGQGLVLSVSFTSQDPAKAARLANAVADAYVIDKLDARFEAARRASSWLNDRLVELKQKLRESEESVAKFRSENDLPAAATNMTLSQEQLAQMNARVVTARAETAEKKARFDLLQKVEGSGGNIGSFPDLMNSGTISELRHQENDLSRQEADLLARYSGSHPAVVNLRAQISDVRRAIGAEIRRLSANVRNELELAKARQAAAEKALADATGVVDLDTEKVIALRELERNAAVNKSLFEDFLARAHVTEQQATYEARDARVITAAMQPGAPSFPKTQIILPAAGVVGFVLGIILAFVREHLNAGFTTPRQLEEMLEVPLLASISKMEARELSNEGAAFNIPEYPHVKPLSRFSEAIRSLRSAIQMSDVDSPPRVLQVSSTIPNEGKTTITLSIASSASQSGARVLIIDGDLRHPSVSSYFKAGRDKGLVEYLVGEVDLQEAIRYDETLRLWYLPAGGKTQNPPDLLASERMKAMVAALRANFDLLLIDTPPMGPVIDPVIVSQLVDKVVFVVRWASTARELVRFSIERLSGHKKVAGVVYNYVIDAQAQKYGKYAYNYYYGGRYYKKYYTE